MSFQRRLTLIVRHLILSDPHIDNTYPIGYSSLCWKFAKLIPMPSGSTTFVIFKRVRAFKLGLSASQLATRAMSVPLVKVSLNCGLITAPGIGCTLRNVGERW